MGTLHLHPSAAHVEEALAATLEGAGEAGGAVALGHGHVTGRQLLDDAFAAVARPVRIGSLGERLLAEAVASEASGSANAVAVLSGRRGFAEALRALFVAWRSAGLAPSQVEALGRRAGPSSSRLRDLSRLFARYVERLAGRADEGEVRRAALATLSDGAASLRMLAGISSVRVHHGAIDPSVIEVVEALARRGLPVTIDLPLVAEPGVPRPLLELALEPLARRIEERPELPVEPRYLPPGLEDERHGEPAAGDPMARVHSQLFRRRADGRREVIGEAAVTLLAAPSPEAEARWVARRVRDLLDGGAAPEGIAVAARDPSRRDRVARWLARYGVLFAERPGRSALSAVPVRLALRLLELADEAVPREGLIALLSSRYVDGWIPASGQGPAIAPHRIARALREAGVRDATDEDGVPGYRRRLGELRAAVGGARAVEIERIAARVEGWVSRIGALPAEDTVAAQAAALTRALDELGIRLRARGFVTDAEAGLDDVEQVAMDQAAVAALFRLLAELPRAAARAGLAVEPVDRRRFARLLESALAGEAVQTGGARGGAVELTGPERLGGRRFRHVIACGLEDGVVPARTPEDVLLSDEDRHRFNQLAGRDVLERAASREAREPLLFLELCAAAGASLDLSFSVADDGGRPLLRSPYLDEIERATGREPLRLDPDPVPRVADCRRPAELRARLALDGDAPVAGRLGEPDPEVTRSLLRAAWETFADERRALAASATIERDRLAFFDGLRPAGRYDGRILDGALRDRLAAALPGSPERPLSASALEDYARCGFRFLARRLLDVEPPDEAGDELDALAGGRLHHRVLERYFAALLRAGRLPLRGAPDDLQLLDESVDAVLAEWAHSEPSGHPALFAVRGRRVRRELHRLVETEAREQYFAPHLPTLFERRFRVALAPLDDHPAIHLHGAVDRVDVSGGSALVIDYKTGRSASYRKLLDEEALLVTSFQLPLYAAAMQKELGVTSVAARYFAIRDARPTEPLADPRRFTLDEPGDLASRADRAEAVPGGQGASPTLGEALRMLHRNMRAGDFAVAPRSCDFCPLPGACRVVVRRGVGDGAGPGGDGGGAAATSGGGGARR